MVHKRCYQRILFFFFNDTPTPEIYPLPLHDALPIFLVPLRLPQRLAAGPPGVPGEALHQRGPAVQRVRCGPAQAVRRMSMRDRRWWVVAALAALLLAGAAGGGMVDRAAAAGNAAVEGAGWDGSP